MSNEEPEVELNPEDGTPEEEAAGEEEEPAGE
jgi:hypothetical protein